MTGDEPMTGPQRSYLSTLAQEAGVEVPARLTKAAASELIEELQQTTGRAGDLRRRCGRAAAGRGTLQVITRAGLITQVGGEELSHRTPTERAAVLDSAVSELGG